MNMEIKETLPSTELHRVAIIYTPASDGNLEYRYAPFQNLKLDTPIEIEETTVDVGDLRLPAHKAGLSIYNPIEIDIEESYDGSANMILNDKANPVKIINPRFYLTSSKTYNIGDRKGNLDTNIYTEDNFKVEANLIKTVQKVVKTEFLGLMEGGKMSVGNYTFYFKLADSDGNESDFVAESGKVVCHIGNINNPKFIRGGQINENSGKSIRFRLLNLDLAYNFINIYYSRTSGDNLQKTTQVYKIEDKFKINGVNTDISITGYEEHSEISLSDINVNYSEFESVKSLENCQNMSFAGGVVNNYELFKTLENYSLFITPKIGTGVNIGNLTPDYVERHSAEEGYEYYNTKNIYYKLGYWEDEIYRLGIVYILNDYTLSPVFNIRGIKELTEDQTFQINTTIKNTINYQEDFIIENTGGLENAKGVFKISSNEVSVFNGGRPITPLGVGVTFNNSVIEGIPEEGWPGLKDLTKGFFIVRQKRIPTILAQAVGISTTKNGNLPLINSGSKYLIESFLKPNTNKDTILGSSMQELNSSEVLNNALLCPEASLRTEIYNNYFNSSEYTLIKSDYQSSASFTKSSLNTNQYYLDNLYKLNTNSRFPIKSSLLLVEPNISLIKNDDNLFSSKAGDVSVAHSNIDVKYGDYADPENTITDIAKYNESTYKIRGIFNTYIGSNYNHIANGQYYNIHEKGYDFNNWKSYFKLRYNDASPFFPISDRMEYGDLTSINTISSTSNLLYRGDCYINTYTHRMNWNFIDPELPTSSLIVDPFTWYKHYRIVNKVTKTVKMGYTEDSDGNPKKEAKSDSDVTSSLSYNKLLPIFTYKSFSDAGVAEENDTIKAGKLIDAEDKHFKKYSERNGVFGFDQLNRPDINAVKLGHWVTYKVCSNINLAMRDVDLSNPSEEALHGMKRSFYPLQSMDRGLKLPESKVINKGLSKTTGDKFYFEVPDVPFIKTNFSTRIHYSNVLQQSSFVNGNRVFLSKNYQDYTTEHGAIIKLVEWYGSLIAVMEHGVLLIPVNERAMMKNESGENVYINTDIVLPKNPKVLSNSFGSMWADSVIKTSRYVYGLDTVGKKIWRTNGTEFEIISDIVIQKFLNDNIKLKETDTDQFTGTNVIKTHYNAFKSDVMFTFKYGEDKWHICWNELLEKWVTRYSWFPEFSENINNIFYTFANRYLYKNVEGVLYKHGFAGTTEEEGVILPTKWYGKQEPFEFEFVAAPNPNMHKIYNNIEIISNRVAPNSFIYEIIGDGFDWHNLKDDIVRLNKE